MKETDIEMAPQCKDLNRHRPVGTTFGFTCLALDSLSFLDKALVLGKELPLLDMITSGLSAMDILLFENQRKGKSNEET